MLSAIRKVLRHASPAPLPSQQPDLIALRRAEARRWLRLRGITHVKGVYGAP